LHFCWKKVWIRLSITNSASLLFTVEDIVGGEVNMANFDISEQQKKLEVLMQQRRERVEKWRQEQSKSKQGEDIESKEESPTETSVEGAENNGTASLQADHKKKWSLEDEFDDDEEEEPSDVPMEEKDDIDDKDFKLPTRSKPTEEPKKPILSFSSGVMQAFGDDDDADDQLIAKKRLRPMDSKESEKPESDSVSKEEEEEDGGDDVDPLDAFMVGIQEQVKKLRGNVVKRHEKIVNNNKVSLVVGVAKKSVSSSQAVAKKKGELLEQNQDGLEYSSEEEGAGADDIQTINQNLQLAKQKKPTTISKEDITFVPFRKDFYIEVPELARMTSDEVEECRSELEGIKVKGKGCPKPIKTWAHAGVSKKILEALKKFGYEKPTPIQAQAVPAIMCGRDLIGIAKTGSGKTLAFLLPMFRHVLDQPPLRPGDGPICIIMTPTRELATQIAAESRKFGRLVGVRVVAVYGGTPISEQISELKPGAEVVVCTPGRMIDMLAANSGRVTNTRRCTYIVLDEADRMFDMGFEPQVMRIIDGVRPDRQTVLFSATFPRIMEALARRILNKPVEVSVGGRSVVCKDIEQNVIVVEEDDKFLKLLELLGRYLSSNGDQVQKSAIVFVDKQENADFLLKELMHASYTCLALHGGIDQTDRDSTIADFKANKVSVLVATSVAARGLDVKHCTLVVNYDCPNHYEDYVHRCGRTGRAGAKGNAWTFVTPDQGRYAADINKALELSGYQPDARLTQLFDSYKSRQEALGKTVKSGGGGGFSGKGFKFDETEAQQVNERRKFQKVALGLQDSDDEDPDADLNKEIENMLAPKKCKTAAPTTLVKSAQGQVSNTALGAALANLNKAVAAAGNGTDNGSNSGGGVSGGPSIGEKLAMAKLLASKINSGLGVKSGAAGGAGGAGGNNVIPSMTNMVPDPLPNAAALNAKSLAEQRAERLHAKLNYVPKEDDDDEDETGESDEKQSAFQRFEQELEINDFPQQARWRVTSKEAIAQIAEYSEAGITVRGTYIPPGGRLNAENGERKLYLAIESTSELAVARAKTEIVRLIREELIKLQTSGVPNSKGRYKVL
jgi:ATP-dependent RNA helicase DDX46/PRP5